MLIISQTAEDKICPCIFLKSLNSIVYLYRCPWFIVECEYSWFAFISPDLVLRTRPLRIFVFNSQNKSTIQSIYHSEFTHRMFVIKLLDYRVWLRIRLFSLLCYSHITFVGNYFSRNKKSLPPSINHLLFIHYQFVQWRSGKQIKFYAKVMRSKLKMYISAEIWCSKKCIQVGIFSNK